MLKINLPPDNGKPVSTYSCATAYIYYLIINLENFLFQAKDKTFIRIIEYIITRFFLILHCFFWFSWNINSKLNFLVLPNFEIQTPLTSLKMYSKCIQFIQLIVWCFIYTINTLIQGATIIYESHYLLPTHS